MKFIFPQNYTFKSKLLGLIDYSTAILNLIWFLFVFLLVNLLFSDFTLKISAFIILAFPVFLFSIIGFNHENIVYVICYLFQYICRPKLYLYRKY